MRDIKFALLTVFVVVISFLVLGTQSEGIIGAYRQMLSPTMFVTWMAGFLGATVSPPVLSLVFWLIAARSHHSWVFHALLIPAMWAIVRGCVVLMLFASGEPDTDSLTGFASDPAILLMVICGMLYFSALAFKHVARSRSLKSGS